MANDGSVKIGTELDKSGLDKGLSGLGSFAKKGAAVLAGTAAAGVAAFGAITKASLDAVAQMEQNVGGVETLFKDSAKTVIDNANKAYKTAGMSANNYMSTVTSFSASLLQSLSGNTAEAARVADMAIIDMSDNANKMGTSMESIQNAYQGFAKQNYTMLDNLKLGYGGTKEEMQRLLADAQELSGVEYDISNLSDVYNAIHVIQEELGITGTTAKEAGTTIEGSMNAAKAAWDNFLAGTASAEELVEAIGVAAGNVGKNLAEIIPRLLATIPEAASLIAGMISDNLPQFVDMGMRMLETIASGIAKGAGALSQKVLDLIPKLVTAISNKFPDLLDAGIEMVNNLLLGISQMAPQVITQISGMLQNIIGSLSEKGPQILEQVINIGRSVIGSLSGILTEYVPQMIQHGINMIGSLGDGLQQAIPQFLANALPLLMSFTEFLKTNAGLLIDAGISFIYKIVDGLIAALPDLIAYVPTIISNIFDIINENVPKLLIAGANIIVKLLDGIVQNIPNLIAEFPKIVKSIISVIGGVNWIGTGKTIITGIANGVKALFTSIPDLVKDIATNAFNLFKNTNWLSLGSNLITKIGSGIKSLITSIPTALKGIADEAVAAFKGVDWLSVGKNIISGIASGVSNAASGLVDAAVNAAKSAIDTVKGWLGIHSPSRRARDEIGVNMIAGVGEGVEKETPKLESVSEDSVKSAVKAMRRVSASEFVADMQSKAYVSAANNEMSAKEKARNNGYEPDEPDYDPEIVIVNEFDVDGTPLIKETVRKTKAQISREQKNKRIAKGDVAFA